MAKWSFVSHMVISQRICICLNQIQVKWLKNNFTHKKKSYHTGKGEDNWVARPWPRGVPYLFFRELATLMTVHWAPTQVGVSSDEAGLWASLSYNPIGFSVSPKKRGKILGVVKMWVGLVVVGLEGCWQWEAFHTVFSNRMRRKPLHMKQGARSVCLLCLCHNVRSVVDSHADLSSETSASTAVQSKD